MKKEFKIFLCAITIVICTMSNSVFAQWNWGPTPVGDRWGQTLNPNGTNNDIKAIGVGNFLDFGSHPDAAFHVNTNYLTPTSGIGLFFTPGEAFRTNGPSTNLNAWRLFTGAGNGTEKGMLFNYGNNPVVADRTNFSLQATVRDMTFFTLPIIGNTVGTERMRIVGETGFVGIGTPTPKAGLEVANGDIAVTAIGTGIILKANNGENYYRVTVDNTGNLTTELVTNL